MIKKVAITVLFAFAAALAAVAQDKFYRINVGDFDELTVVDHLNVTYRCVPDSAGIVTFRVNPAHVSDLWVEKKNLKLKIQNDGLEPDSIFTDITVYSTTLKSATNWGNAVLTVDTLPPLTQFKAKVIGNGSVVIDRIQATQVNASVQAGNGRVYIAGKAHTASLQLMSAGSIEAGALAASVVRCRMYGTGSIDCSPSEELSVAGLTSGTDYYKGKDVKVVNRSIGAKIVCIDSDKKP